ISTVTKHMHTVEVAEGLLMLSRGIKILEQHPRDARILIQKARKRLMIAKASGVCDPMVFLKIAATSYHLWMTANTNDQHHWETAVEEDLKEFFSLPVIHKLEEKYFSNVNIENITLEDLAKSELSNMQETSFAEQELLNVLAEGHIL